MQGTPSLQAGAVLDRSILGDYSRPIRDHAERHERGRYLLVGFSGGLGGIARALVTGGLIHLRGRARFVTGAADPKQADLVFLPKLIDAGKLRTVIGQRYRLDEIAEAHRYADTGHKIGNVAVLIGD